ncbi:MAG: mobile mystery protein B [Alphaproteobacteria bacterium]|nr:MAG: mobile mystery protein B [Alphaproteobacteria bacterium]
MNDLLFAADDAATLLTGDEKRALIPSHITLRRELNEAEQAGILAAYTWAFSRRRDVLDEDFLLRLHKEMFKDVWKWAGEYSKENNRLPVGLDGYKIRPAMHQLVQDARYWIENKTCAPDEIAARFHHRLVQIHPFPNGNGRHARLATDLLAAQLGIPAFSWGRENIGKVGGETRKKYVEALRAADNHDFDKLMEFMRS